MELKFKYKCQFCGQETKMSTNDIIDFIIRSSSEQDPENIKQFFTKPGSDYNLCPKCAREEGFDVPDFEGWED